MSNIDYTLWPNVNGTLGEIKISIPDGETVKWPEGDALVGNFVYKDGLISGFVDTAALITNESKSSTIPYDYVNIHLGSIVEGEANVVGGERTKYFTVTYGNRFAEEVFKYKGCKTVDDVKTVDANYKTNDIVDGVWSERLDDLEDGTDMFLNCTHLNDVKCDLGSLKEGFEMFYDCRLYDSTIINLANSLNETDGGTIHFTPYNYAKPTGILSEALINAHNKGWNVYFHATKYPLPNMTISNEEDESQEEIYPYFAKAVEVTPEKAKYVDGDGKFYRILGGNFIYVDDPETYGMFTCEEDAAANMRLTKIERN